MWSSKGQTVFQLLLLNKQ